MARRPLLLLTLLAFALRIGFLFAEPRAVPAGDEPAWVMAGLHYVLKTKHPFSPFQRSLFFYPPAYPYLIAAARRLFGTTRALLWLQALLGALLVPIVGRIGARVSPRGGVAAATLCAVYPELIWYSAHYWSETVFLCLLWYALERTLAADHAGAGTAAAAGFLMGLASLTRETTLWFIPAVAVWLFWRRPRVGRLGALVFILSAALTIAPWTIRNWIIFRAFVPVSTGGALNLWEGNTRLPRNEVYALADAIPDPIDQYRQSWSMALASIAERQPWWLAEKLSSEMPAFWGAESEAAMHLERGAYGPVPPWAPAAARRLLALPYLLVLGLALATLAAMSLDRCGGLLIGFSVYYNLLHVVSHAMDRYRLPILPALLVFAGAGWTGLRSGDLGNALRVHRARAVAAALVWGLVAFWSLR